MAVSPLTSEDEPAAINLVRHTTHFINWPGRKLEDGGIRALAADFPAGEAWVVRVRDRFGDYGVSGALTFGIERRTMKVGLLFLTWPVVGRQVEYALMAWVEFSCSARRGYCRDTLRTRPGQSGHARSASAVGGTWLGG